MMSSRPPSAPEQPSNTWALKYSRLVARDWRIATNGDQSLHAAASGQTNAEQVTESLDGMRFIGDDDTWTIQFPDAGDILKEAAGTSSFPPCRTRDSFETPRLYPVFDPLTLNSFTLVPKLSGFAIRHAVLRCRKTGAIQWTNNPENMCYVIAKQMVSIADLWAESVHGWDLEGASVVTEGEAMLANWTRATAQTCLCMLPKVDIGFISVHSQDCVAHENNVCI